jgi:hypothetical protein
MTSRKSLSKYSVSIFIPIVAIWLWDLRNNYLFYNLLQFLTFVLFITYILYKESRSWNIVIGREIFFSANKNTDWLFFFNCRHVSVCKYFYK